ncbi:hypothetical protein WOLCODRAFT_154107 [Wolfiporia cocos MD-104 SS10]|uniref:Uncharacterized protein n=1 Tax=Wolfiporia cocos (strain MD-104) TaxID=742152 RepID=A0A2H3JRD6_WOLCO|nr:hypothetical protein WOLCODRAFT_154107 [Wolfiporia cocos MD-104 SS10]
MHALTGGAVRTASGLEWCRVRRGKGWLPRVDRALQGRASSEARPASVSVTSFGARMRSTGARRGENAQGDMRVGAEQRGGGESGALLWRRTMLPMWAVVELKRTVGEGAGAGAGNGSRRARILAGLCPPSRKSGSSTSGGTITLHGLHGLLVYRPPSTAVLFALCSLSVAHGLSAIHCSLHAAPSLALAVVNAPRLAPPSHAPTSAAAGGVAFLPAKSRCTLPNPQPWQAHALSRSPS